MKKALTIILLLCVSSIYAQTDTTANFTYNYDLVWNTDSIKINVVTLDTVDYDPSQDSTVWTYKSFLDTTYINSNKRIVRRVSKRENSQGVRQRIATKALQTRKIIRKVRVN